MNALASTFTYRVFNGDFDRPLFSNFMGGQNGWYRVGYSNRLGFGYGPWDMSIAALQGGYGSWMKFNPDLVRVFSAAYEMVVSTDLPMREHFSERYETHFWSNFVRTPSFDLSDASSRGSALFKMQFYPSICF